MNVQEDLKIEDVRVNDETRCRTGGLQVFRMRDGQRIWPHQPNQNLSLDDFEVLGVASIDDLAKGGDVPYSGLDHVLALLQFQSAILAAAERNPQTNLVGSGFAQGLLRGLGTVVPTAVEFVKDYLRDWLNW